MRKALLYELPRKQGRRKFVRTYAAFAQLLPSGERFNFAVVRDSSDHAFREIMPENPFGEKGECPASGDLPYFGRIREDGPVGFRIQLYEEKCGNDYTIIGASETPRQNIQIHFGAAATYGCLMVAGRRREYNTGFERWMRAMLERDLDEGMIRIIVEPR